MSYPNRTFCDTIAEMRKLVSSMSIFSYIRNKAILTSLIEECQTYGNRMEAALTYQHDIEVLHRKKAELESEIKALRAASGAPKERKRFDELFD